MIEGIGDPVYCVLRFEGGVCKKVEMLKVAASTQ